MRSEGFDRMRRGALLASVLLGIALAIPSSSGLASAAEFQTPGSRFVYELCDPQLVPGGDPPAFTHIGNSAYADRQDCGVPGGAIGLYPTARASSGPAAISVSVAATPGGFVESDAITAYAANMQYGNQKSFVAAEYWPPFDGQEHTRTFPIRTAPPAGCEQCEVGGGVEIYMSCREGERCEPTGQIGARYIAATEVDPVPPTIGKIEGAFLSGATLRGHQLLSPSATDIGGGLSVLEVLVNGAVAPGALPGACAVSRVRNPSYIGVAAYSPSPCPAELKGAWNLDTAEAPFHEGINSVQVCASDFSTAGPPNTTCSPPQSVNVDDSCTASAVPGGQKLTAGFLGGGSGETVTVPFETAAQVTGELTTGSGAPVAGATICVQTQVVGETSPVQTVATATTDSNGTFTYELPAGPDRQLVLGYRDDSFLVTRTLSFGSRVKPSIELSQGRIKRGGTVEIVGALPGPSAAGRIVILQASSLHGARWLTFRKATTGLKGGFRASYRFGGTSGTTTYRIRALVPRQVDYPWEPGHSIARRIKVFAGRAHAAGKKKLHRHRHRRSAPKKKTKDRHRHGGVGA